MDPHFDWIAVGSGASGLASALWAAHRGLKAIVVEKAPVVGGATAYSYGGLWAPNNMLQRAAAMDDSDEQGLEYLRFLSGGFAEEEKMRMYVKEAAATIEASVADPTFLDVNDASVVAHVTGPGLSTSVPLRWTGDRAGLYRGTAVRSGLDVPGPSGARCRWCSRIPTARCIPGTPSTGS